MQTPEDQNNNIRDDGRVIAPSPFDEMRPAHQAVASETVDSVEAPRRARVDDAVEQPEERRKDYLEGFLKERPQGISGNEPGGDLYESVIAALKEIYDPEIPVNIYDLGLIYGVEISDDGHANVTMTLTTPHCPVAESMPGEVELRVGSVPGVGDAEVNLVWDPPWDPQKMSDEAKLELWML
jgi:FeS assembly SUF system protein